MGLRSLMEIHTKWIRNKHTHTHTRITQSPQVHTQQPQLAEATGTCPASHPSITHVGYSHARWTRQYSTDGREDTGHRAGRDESETTQRGREKKRLPFFSRIKTDECRCQQSCRRKKTGRECDGRRRKDKDRLKGRAQKKVVKLSNIWEINYCGRCTALFFPEHLYSV